MPLGKFDVCRNPKCGVESTVHKFGRCWMCYHAAEAIAQKQGCHVTDVLADQTKEEREREKRLKAQSKRVNCGRTERTPKVYRFHKEF